ncbi:hypothetical protein ASE12_19310 [Aeromicrobium sp. Root236]|nr:hypothetical protein ASE12_19310 [Aeromicrobium sp. Root236]
MLGLVVLVPIAMVALYALASADHDPLELIDSSETAKALTPVCHDAASVASLIPTNGSITVRVEALNAYATAAQSIPSFVATMSKDDLESDIPTEDWGADWTVLLAELDRYTDALAAGTPAYFEIPSTPDGFSILGRMNLASPLKSCDVPAAIAALDLDPPRLPPGLPSDMYSAGLGPS